MTELWLPKGVYRAEDSEEILTDWLNPNEVCMGLWQGPVGNRWIQKIFVVRDDTIAKHMTDCGAAIGFIRIPIEIIPGDGETTVAEFLYEAERHRHDLFPWRHQERVKAESTLKDVIPNNRAKRRELIRNRSISGPFITVQRTEYSHEAAVRRFKDGKR